MNLTTRSVTTAAGVAVAAMAVVVGSSTRDRIDIGGRNLAEAPITTLVASRDNASVPEGDYFYEIANLLKREYVEKIPNEAVLASGAVRGMIGSLGDPNSLYMGKDEFASFLRRRQGNYEGIGVELALVLPPTTKPKQASSFVDESGEATPAGDMVSGIPRIPKVTVIGVVPGGPADKAGVKPGDVVADVDNHWVWDSDLIVRFRNAQRLWQAKKLDRNELNAIRKEVRDKTEHDLLPLKARQRLMLGKQGPVKIVWSRKGASRTTTINKAESQLPGFSAVGSTIRLPLMPGSSEGLRQAIARKTQVTIDLTNNALGDVGEMKKCLAVLAPKGTYGYLLNQRGSKPQALEVETGNSKPPKITLKVDATTRGAAQILADALRLKGHAQLLGTLAANDRQLFDIVSLPDGSGYTLVTQVYRQVVQTRTARRPS